MTNRLTVPAHSMADRPGEYSWRCYVEADLTSLVKCARKRIQLGLQAAKEPQC